MVNEKLTDNEKIHLNFSAGWLAKFKARWGLRVLRSHGEGGDADINAVFRELPGIKEKLKTYSAKNIFIADECGLFFKMAPDKTIAVEILPGPKKAKDRITLLPCCNADGTEKVELMIIGRAFRPRVFKKKTG